MSVYLFYCISLSISERTSSSSLARVSIGTGTNRSVSVGASFSISFSVSICYSTIISAIISINLCINDRMSASVLVLSSTLSCSTSNLNQNKENRCQSRKLCTGYVMGLYMVSKRLPDDLLLYTSKQTKHTMAWEAWSHLTIFRLGSK